MRGVRDCSDNGGKEGQEEGNRSQSKEGAGGEEGGQTTNIRSCSDKGLKPEMPPRTPPHAQVPLCNSDLHTLWGGGPCTHGKSGLWRACPLLEAPQPPASLCRGRFNLPLQSLPKGFLVLASFLGKRFTTMWGHSPSPKLAPPLSWHQGHPIPPRFLSDSLPGPCPLPLSETKLEGKTGGVGAQA